MWLTQGSWTFPANNNLLFQAGVSYLYGRHVNFYGNPIARHSPMSRSRRPA